ncbi:hypothetical protein nbrc107696_13410 [Gordonia spumicola]|uniref:ER-bound oxygenase mpaB/mpaB'/Rubber oxygenase catalytic domain-containing protein n=2 Tax=Gordonia spumicola TaxID=589161 RepID=A0A7I9V683_9ACTN|nr:hypothetical protein nbrc107696_13410 [Gordonia spumicola]
MQLAHPAIAPTEAQSGAYANRGAQRWSGTVNYLRMVAGGDDEVNRLLVREVNRVHAGVRVPDGSAVRRPAFDADNQRWVAATWFLSMIDVYRLLVSDIDDDVLDLLLADFARVGSILQMDLDDWPRDFTAFEEYVAAVQEGFPSSLPRSGPDADPEQVLPGDVAAQVFSAYSLPFRFVRWAPRIRVLTWGMAGPDLRTVYGIDWNDETQRRFEATVRRLRRITARHPFRRRRARRSTRRAIDGLRPQAGA